MEYGLTLLLYLVIFLGTILAVAFLGDILRDKVLYLFLTYIPMMWIRLAQSAKRCHDINRSGWYQIIPFYTLVLLFDAGTRGKNEYGPDPKRSSGFDLSENTLLDL